MSALATRSPKDWLRLTADDLDCQPAYVTPRNLDRPTLGPQLARIAAKMGKPFMPWQHLVANTAMEVDPDTNLLVYGEVRLTLPRQQGKTCLTIPVMAHRCLAWDGQVVTYAAQTRDASVLKLREDHEPLLHPFFGDRYTPTWGIGKEKLTWDNRSVWGVSATTSSAGHGPTLDLGVADEAWAQKDNRIDAAWVPAMMTRANSQFWIPSTMGTDESLWFNGKVDTGREIAKSGNQQDIAYFEWSLTEDDDPADPENWWRCMPALGHTVTVGKIRQAFAQLNDLAEFARAYCNIKKGTKAAKSLVDIKQWESLADPRSQANVPYTFGVAVAPFGNWASVAIAAPSVADPDRMHVEVIAHRGGTEWIVPYLLERAPRWHPIGIGVDFGGPAGVIRQEILNAGFQVWTPALQDSDPFTAEQAMLTVPTMQQWAQASGEMREAIKDGRVVWLGPQMQPQLNRAVAGAKSRPLGDAWAWGRKDNAEISPLEAATLARWVQLVRKPFYDLSRYDVAQSVF